MPTLKKWGLNDRCNFIYVVFHHWLYVWQLWKTYTSMKQPKMFTVSKYSTDKGVVYDESQITLHNYKEPLSPVKKGFGYYGTISATIDGKYIQCHICGGLYENLGGHLRGKHQLLGREYKERFGLAFMSALVSENYRNENTKRSLLWWASLSEKDKDKYKTKARANYKTKKMPQPKQTLETLNKNGTCPAQLLEKIKEVAQTLGHTPSKKEFIATTGTQRYVHLIYKTFGSWTTAVETTGRIPKDKNHGRGGNRKYTNDQLLDYLANFAQENGRVPSYTDFYRNLLPTLGVYERRWGNLENARQEAGVYEILESKKK